MLIARELLTTKPHNSLNDAIWWTEFIMKHKGAPQLRNSVAQEAWHKKYDTDVIAFISIAASSIFSLCFLLIYRILNHMFSNHSKVVEKKKYSKKNK